MQLSAGTVCSGRVWEPLKLTDSQSADWVT